jgi:hypothetical protein
VEDHRAAVGWWLRS